MFRPQFSDHHQGFNHCTCAITTYQRAYIVVFQYVAVCCLYVYTYDVPMRVVTISFLKLNHLIWHVLILNFCINKCEFT
jgi:hypothetical protein